MRDYIHKPDGFKHHGRVNLKSPIFWRITTGVFASILLIEIALLIFSWYTERDRLLSRLDDSLVTVASLLDTNNPLPQLEKLLQNESSLSNYRVTSYVYESASGSRYMGGRKVALDQVANENNPKLYSSSNASYTRFIARELTEGRADKLWLCVDASSIGEYMTGYIWRIVGMVLLISVFVTGACLIFMHPLLIKPLQRLDNLLIHGEKNGIRMAAVEGKDLVRRDEIGSVFRSFSHLRNDLIKSEDDKTFITERFEEFANLGADCFFEMNKDWVFTYITGDVTRLLSITTHEIIGNDFDSFMVKMNDKFPAKSDLLRALKVSGKWEGKLLSSTDDQHSSTVRIASSKFYDDNGNFAGIRGTIVDTSKETELANDLRYQATHDPLTGLCNRRELNERIERQLTQFRADGTTFTLLTLDLDRFKTINDTCGHIAGDTLLKALASSMSGSVRSTDTVARIGGDEFAIILNSANTADAYRIADQLRKAIDEYELMWEGKPQSVSVSIGLAEVSDELCDLEAIIFASDNCCIAAKNAGKNQINMFRPGENGVDDQELSA